MNKLHCLFMALLLMFSYSNNAKAIRVAGKISYASEALDVSNSRFRIIVDTSFPSSRFETEAVVSTGDSNSGVFSVDVGDVSQKVFIVSATCIENCGLALGLKEYFYSRGATTDIYYDLATFFENETQDILNLEFVIAEINKISGHVHLPKLETQSVLLTLDRKEEDYDLPIDRDPRPTRGFLPPQRNVVFWSDRVSRPYSIYFVKNPNVSYSLTAGYNGCCGVADKDVTLVNGGQMLPNPNQGTGFLNDIDPHPNAFIFNSAAGPLNIDLYPLALTGPIAIEGRIVIDSSEVSTQNRNLHVEIIASAQPSKPIVAKRVTLLGNSAEVGFEFESVLGDPSGSDLQVRIGCQECDEKRPRVIKGLALSPRSNHAGIVVNLKTRKNIILIGPLLLLDD